MIGNHSTYRPGGFYETFPPAKAKALWDRFEFVDTHQARQLAQHCRGRTQRLDPPPLTFPGRSNR